MQIEARFTLKGENKEIPFTIATGKTETEIYLFSLSDGNEIKYPLVNDNGLLRLPDNLFPFEENEEVVVERLTGLSSDWLENRSQGFESTTDFVDTGSPGYGPDDIFVENKPFSLRQIKELIDLEDIELAPDFQRNFIWDRTRQSKLIESILLGLPLPSVYLSQYEDGRLTVVDGLQRLSTIKRFMDNDLVLHNLEYLKECNGMKFKDLEKALSPLRIRKFGQTQVMCFVIDFRSPSQLKFDLFRRLNTGGKPLNNQEIRNCLSRTEVQRVLKKMVDLDSFGNATGWSVKDTRMEAREAALRFIYFYEQYSPTTPTGSYSGDMEKTLDAFIDSLNKRNYIELEKYIEIYDSALKNAYHLFGKYCFRKITAETLYERRSPVNKLLMLTISILLSKYETGLIASKFPEAHLIEPLAGLISDNEQLYQAITYGTNGKWNIETGFEEFKKFFDEHLSTQIQ